MFYEKQDIEQRNNYKNILMILGGLSFLFSDSDSPYLPYRAHENAFCKCFKADNLSRKDCSIDARKNQVGVGLKTWVGNDDQKIAEFGRLRDHYKNLENLDLIRFIAEVRNQRIKITENIYGINEMIYHIVKRLPNTIQIMESSLDYIDIDKITILPNKGNNNNTYFTDGNHTYHFSTSKNTLYMIFDDLVLIENINVKILKDPFEILVKTFLQKMENDQNINNDYQNEFEDLFQFYDSQNIKDMVSVYYDDIETKKETQCLRLYSVINNKKYVPSKSGLNQWNAGGRKRDFNEIYIPLQKTDRKRKKDFFPPRDTQFKLTLPDGKVVIAKVCQEADNKDLSLGKAIMTNPNKELGEWLLRKVFEVQEGTIITYDLLEKFGIDSVIFTKNDYLDYSVDFSELGTYEKFYDNEDIIEE